MSAAHELIDRLNAGWVMCDAEPDPARRARLEDHWIRLLHLYEECIDRSMLTGVTP